MLDLKTDIPVRADVIEQVQSNFAQIRDLMDESRDLLHLAIESKQNMFYTRKELAELFKCDEKKIPRSIPRTRVGNQWLFSKIDIDEFIKSHTH